MACCPGPPRCRHWRCAAWASAGTAPTTPAARPPSAGSTANTLLRWSQTPGAADRYLALRSAERAGLSRFLAEADQIGSAGRVLLCLVEAEHGPDAVAFGLVCAALWRHAGNSASNADYQARGRAERWLGEEPPAHGPALDELVAAFGRACEEFVAAQLTMGRSAAVDDIEAAAAARRLTGYALDRAAALTRQFGAGNAAQASPLLHAGIEARFEAVGVALTGGVEEQVAASVRDLGRHLLAPEPAMQARIERARMAQRLARWLSSEPEAECATIAAGLDRHIAETGWVDYALEHIEAGGDSDPGLRAAYSRLAEAVRARRRAIDHGFARTLASWTKDARSADSMLTVESFLSSVVAPVAKSGDRGVLLLVLDGMSAAIAAELGEELREHWAEYDPVPEAKRPPRRRGMVAALPTVTAVSRTSLFAGRLMSGSQADEKRLFPTHTFWGGTPAAVFHKDDLRGEAGEPFGRALTEALADDQTHVAVVLNTIDDRLAKEQRSGEGGWQVGSIPKLAQLLQAAAGSGRAVLITSDHGHVVDRHGERVVGHSGAADRYRPADGDTLAPTEIALSGPRVVAPESGNAVVALWDADSRYTAKKAGYHGGAAPAEVAIPIFALLPFAAEPAQGMA
ncbi:BREX-2 system phosphatase PglZ [Yinghuangia aomiensis]